MFLIVYHFQTDGLSEQMNHTIKIIIWFLVISHSDKDWDLFLLSLQIQLNSAKHTVTEVMLNKLIYSFNSRLTLNTFNEPHEETVSDFTITETQKMLQQKATEMILFVNVKSKICYNFNHQLIKFKKNNQVFLWLHKDYNLSGKSLKNIKSIMWPFQNN